ncbi:MAG: glycosyltransferase family 2 protein [Actinobacteria bacterium]|nr:glycosyltransferase family 2 protein [Actinomycetota bacterium]
MKISAVISAYNEEKKIKDCLESVKWVDEIIFVDNSSEDSTSEIAHKYTSKVFIRPNNKMLNINKNFGFTKAKNDWILSLDADERISEDLKKEIESLGNREDLFNGYWIPRKNIIFGKWIKHTGWYPDYQLRLFKKHKGRFPEKHVHEMVLLEGATKNLSYPIAHYNYETITQFLNKQISIYAPNEVENLLEGDYKFNKLDIIRFPLKEFMSRFFAREGYKDGFHGLMLSMLMAFYHLIIFAKIWEIQGFKEYENDNLLNELSRETKKSYKEISFWLANEKIKNTNSFLKKNLIKIQRKFF